MLFSPWRPYPPRAPAPEPGSVVALEQIVAACSRALVESQAALDADARGRREAWTGEGVPPTWFVWRSLRVRVSVALAASPKTGAGGRTGLVVGARRAGSASLTLGLRRKPDGSAPGTEHAGGRSGPGTVPHSPAVSPGVPLNTPTSMPRGDAEAQPG